MSRRLRIVVADDEPDMQEYFRDVLARLGHEAVGVARTGDELVAQVQALRPDLAITDIKMPGMDGLEAVAKICQHGPLPVVIVSAHADERFVERAEKDHIFAYLVKPVRETNLGPAIRIAMRRFDEFQALRQEANDLRQALNDRKLIERAKGIIMKQAQLDEEAAFRRLQKIASSTNKRLAEVAAMVVATSQALEPESRGPG
jgi:response regulator NasT